MGLAERLRRRREETNDLEVDSDVDLVEAEAPPAPKSKQFGRPTPCPECSGRGYLDHLDMVDRIQYQHCTVCGHEWQITEAEIMA